MMTTFYLVSTELRDPYSPRRCEVVRRLRTELRDDLALVDVIPPLNREIYDSEADIDRLVLGARHEGASLFPVSDWPLPVYICVLDLSPDADSIAIDSELLSIIDWGEIRRAPDL